jgi:O-antigen ligase
VIAARPLQPTDPLRLLRYGLLAAACVVFGVGLAIGLSPIEIPGWEMVAGGLALLGLLCLTVARYDWAVALGFLLFAAVKVEPAPVDAVFAVVIAVALVTGRFTLANTPLGPALAVSAFIALNILSCLAALDPVRAVQFMSITIYLGVFGLWVASWCNSEDRARTLLRIYIGTAAVTALVGSAALFVPFPGHTALTAYTDTRARGLFKDPNVFGPFLVPAFLLLLQELIEPRLLRSSRFRKLIMLAAIVCGILFSYSRAAWLDLVVGVVAMGVVLALRRGGSRRAFVFVLVTCVSAVVIVASIEVTGQLNFLKERAHYQTYDNQRFGAQSGGIQLGEHNPIGIGPGQFELVEPISAHSTYVRSLAEEGVLGFCVLVGILFGTLILALRNAVMGWDTHGIGSTALLAAWAGILANSAFVDTLHWRHLWLVAGLIWAAKQAQRSSSAGTRLLR